MTTRRAPLTEAQRQQLAALILLDRVISEPGGYHAALMETQEDAFLEPVFRHLQAEDLVEVGEEDRFRPTRKGQETYQKLLQQRQSYLAHFEIFARVDLAEGSFGDPNDPMAEERWSDLRVAVAEYKGIDPYRMVFLAMLSDEAFFQEREWKFDLALGSNFFKELDEIVASQITIEELGYHTEEGEWISGEAVIEDVILQGARVNHERWERERAAQQSLLERALPGEAGAELPGAEGGEIEWVYVPYDPGPAMALYAGSALFVEAMWLSALW